MQEVLVFGKMINQDAEQRNPENIQDVDDGASGQYEPHGLFQPARKGDDEGREQNHYTHGVATFDDPGHVLAFKIKPHTGLRRMPIQTGVAKKL